MKLTRSLPGLSARMYIRIYLFIQSVSRNSHQFSFNFILIQGNTRVSEPQSITESCNESEIPEYL